jgi:hypothetical protein
MTNKQPAKFRLSAFGVGKCVFDLKRLSRAGVLQAAPETLGTFGRPFFLVSQKYLLQYILRYINELVHVMNHVLQCLHR